MPTPTNINMRGGTAGGSFTTDDMNLLQSIGLDPDTIALSNIISGLDYKGRVTGSDSVFMSTTFGDTAGYTSAGTAFDIPAFTSTANNYATYRQSTGHGSYLNLHADQGADTMGVNMVEYTDYVNQLRQAAEAEDIQRGIDATVAGTQNIVDQSAAGQRVYIDEQTVNPEETGQFFDDLGVMTDGGDFYGPGVSATQQQSALDTYGFENVGTDAGELDATVQGQVQIRSDITGATETINQNTLSMALSLLDGMGIDSSTLIPEYDEINGVTVYRTPEGKDVSSLISTLGSTIQQKIDDSSAAQMAALGYGGTDQPTLFTDLAAIKSAVDAGPDLSDVQTLSQDDISSALTSQFGKISGEISGVGGQVTAVQETVDAVEETVGTLDERQLQMVEDLRLLGVDTEAIITAVEGVQATVDPLGAQITGAAQGVRQDIAAQGGTVEGLFGAQTQALGGGASASAVQQVAGDLQGLKSTQDAQTATLSDLATAEGQTAVKQLVEDVKASASDIDTAIKDNVLPEFEDIFEIFDDQGKLIGEINTETGKIVSSVAPNGDVIIDRLTEIDTAVDTGFGGIDLSNLDESSALTTLTKSIDDAASTFTADYSSMETNIDNDRVAVLKAIQEDSTALDNFLSTRLPTVITTEFGDYELKVGENNEALVTKIAADTATAVDFNQADLVSALSAADAYDETALISAIGFNPSDAAATKTAAETAATEAASAKDQARWARGRITTVQEKLIPNLSTLLTTETDALDNLVAGQTKQIGENFVEIDKDLGLIITDTTGIETNLGKLDTSSVQSAVDSLNNLDSSAITAAVNASDLSTLKASDVTDAVDLTTIESTVDDIKAGNIATLGELDDSEITALANAVDYDADALVSSVNKGRLEPKDLTALSTLTSDDITNAVDLSGLSTLTAGEVKTAVDYDSTQLTSDFKTAIGTSEQALTELANGNVATIKGEIGTYQLAVTGEGELLVTAFDNITGEVRAVDSKVGNLDLTALGDIDSIKTTVEALPAEALDISGLATSSQVGQVGSAVAGQAVSLGNIDNIKSDVTTLLSKAEEDLQNNTARDKQIEASRTDVLQAVSDTLSANKSAMSLLLNGQTLDIQGELGSYRVGLDSETGKLTAAAINSQTLALGGQIDTATGQLKTDAKSNTNFLEQQVLNARDAVNNKVGTAFNSEGKLIADSVAANGDEIKRVLDAEGVLTETIIDTKGIVTDTIKTDLSALVDDTGRLNETALAIASDTGGIESLQQLFDAQGKLVREDIDELGRDVIREIDRSGRFVNEAYYQDGYLVEEKQLRIDEIFKKLFPTDPLAQPEELSAADRRFLQGFRTEGLMSPY